MPLKGVKVLEFVGLAPAPFCGKILSDFGATVTRIDKSFINYQDVLRNGKRTLAVNLKLPEGQSLVKSLCKEYDVVLEPFRPGVMERLNLGPDTLLKENSKLVYARLTGFGQTGTLAKRAGHDINYLAISGILSFLGRKNENPLPPINLLADFAAGGLLCAFGICLALLERHKSGKGQIVDSAMVDGAAYIGSWLLYSQKLPIWGKSKGENLLDSGAFFYEVYETLDGKFMSVGSLEPEFYQIFVEKLGLPDLEQSSENEKAKSQIKEQFLTKTQQEWADIFEKYDACVYPVVDWEEAWKHEHNRSRGIYKKASDGTYHVRPAPHLSRSPGTVKDNYEEESDAFQIAQDILKDIQKTENDIRNLIASGVLNLHRNKM